MKNDIKQIRKIYREFNLSKQQQQQVKLEIEKTKSHEGRGGNDNLEPDKIREIIRYTIDF